jgi:cytoplasmic iron level regulating protein YaaA (DUF328/UPF0246 family)
MGTKPKNTKIENLYKFWQQTITQEINQQLKNTSDNTLINLASNEYFKAIDKKQLKANIITPIFKENKNGTYKTIAIYAKRARGLMTRFIVENNIQNTEHIKTFDYEGYTFNPNLSKPNEWIFIR